MIVIIYVFGVGKFSTVSGVVGTNRMDVTHSPHLE